MTTSAKLCATTPWLMGYGHPGLLCLKDGYEHEAQDPALLVIHPNLHVLSSPRSQGDDDCDLANITETSERD